MRKRKRAASGASGPVLSTSCTWMAGPAARRHVHARNRQNTKAMRCQARQTPKPCAPNLLRVRQLRFAEFARVGDAASEAPKRLLRRVKWAGAVVGVRGVAQHLVQGEEVAAEGAAQAHGRVG